AERKTVTFQDRLGQALVEGGFITSEQLDQARETAGTEEKRLTDALESGINFYNDSNPDNPLPPDTPIYPFGSAVEAALGRPITEFEPPLRYPPDFPKAELAVNIDLILKEL
ncbi:hypothetical protein ACFLX0_01830, partial [Chloroflexota bacterium]